MKHSLTIKILKKRTNDGVLNCRHVTVRERLLRFLFGRPVKLTVLVAGDTVDEVAIREAADNDDVSK